MQDYHLKLMLAVSVTARFGVQSKTAEMGDPKPLHFLYSVNQQYFTNQGSLLGKVLGNIRLKDNTAIYTIQAEFATYTNRNIDKTRV